MLVELDQGLCISIVRVAWKVQIIKKKRCLSGLAVCRGSSVVVIIVSQLGN